MKILQDLHIHSHHSCDSAAATLPDIKSERDALGLQHYAVTDHLHTRYNISDIESCRHAFLGYNFPENYHFGIEVSCVGTRECERVAAGDFIASGDTPIYGFRDEPELFDGRISIDLTEEDIKKYGIEFVVAGIHWPLGVVSTPREAIDNYFMLEMFLASHPLVDVVAHPWDSISLAAGGWFQYRDKEHICWEVFKEIPQSYADRLGEEILKNGKLAEINMPCTLNVPDFVTLYMMKMYRSWKEMGVKFTIGSDQHAPHADAELFARMEKVLDEYGFTEDDFKLPFQA